jgi:hypothetical protein
VQLPDKTPPTRKLPIRAPLQGSVPPFGSAVVQCMFIPSALIHTLLGNQGLCPRRSTRPPLRPTQKWPPSLSPHHPLHAQNLKTTDQVPLRRVPLWAWPNVSRCPWLSWRYAESNRKHRAAGWGVTTCTFIQGRIKRTSLTVIRALPPPPRNE